LFLIMVSSVGLGMVISALSGSLERAVTYNTLLAVVQVALNGSLFKLPLLVGLPSLLLPARLGLAAIASYADLNRYRFAPAYQDVLWTQSPIRFWMLLIGMVTILLASVGTAVRITERRWHG